MSESCENCRYWRADRLIEDGGGVHADCRRMPPTSGGKDRWGHNPAVFVVTDRDQWCGEWAEASLAQPDGATEASR